MEQDDKATRLVQAWRSDFQENESLVDGVFKRDAYVKFAVVSFLLGSLFFPPLLVFVGLVHYWAVTNVRSLKLKVTADNVVFQQGSYNCCWAWCWGEQERFVPLEKVTDVTWGQSWLQRVCGVDLVTVRTAAGGFGGEPQQGGADISLLGLHDSKRIRDVILAAKADKERRIGSDGCGNQPARGAMTTGPVTTVAPQLDTAQLATIMQRQLEILERMERGQNAA